MTSLVLASASPARLSLLRRVGIDPIVCVSEVDEGAVTAAATAGTNGVQPADIALVLARAKAEDVCRQLRGSDYGHLVLGCDSILDLDGAALGKPESAQQARERWKQMRGRSGVLHTGHWLVDERSSEEGGTGGMIGASASTVVHFADLDDEEIADYVATGEPQRVAGAFTLDGVGAAFVSAIEGDASNVVGLSLPLLRELLGGFGVRWFDLAHPNSYEGPSRPAVART